MISHRNVIANVLQISAFERPYRESLSQSGVTVKPTEVALGLLPQSHIYSLVVVCHATGYRGDQTINLPRYDLKLYLNAIQRFKINSLFLVSVETTTYENIILQIQCGNDATKLGANGGLVRYHRSLSL